MDRTNIETIHQVLSTMWHRETRSVIRKIAENDELNIIIIDCLHFILL